MARILDLLGWIRNSHNEWQVGSPDVEPQVSEQVLRCSVQFFVKPTFSNVFQQCHILDHFCYIFWWWVSQIPFMVVHWPSLHEWPKMYTLFCSTLQLSSFILFPNLRNLFLGSSDWSPVFCSVTFCLLAYRVRVLFWILNLSCFDEHD